MATDYQTVRSQIQDGDLLLYRPASLLGYLIRGYGRGRYSHAEMAAWWGDDLFTIGITGLEGGRAKLLSGQVAKWPGRIDVRFVDENRYHTFDRAGAVGAMKEIAGYDYGRIKMWKALVYHTPLIRMFWRPKLQSDGRRLLSPPTCSESVVWAARTGGGVDPVPNLADEATEPADLGRSLLWASGHTLK